MIADKSPVVRAGLDDYIRKDGRFDVVGVVANGLEFASLAEARRADIGVVGWALPDMTGGALLAMLKRRQIATRIVVYTGDTGTDVLREAIREGAWSFISKSADPVVLANGWTNLQIAARTGISSNTVKYHLKNLYDKLGVSNRAMAVALYVARERDQR